MKKFLLSLCTVALAAMLCVGIFAAETVIYENDFSNPATISDFKQYRMEWEIKDGGLYLTEKFFPGTTNAVVDTSFAHIIYQSKEKLADYIIEFDYINFQTAGGVIFRADQDKADAQDSGFYGYQAFIANDANKGALGSGGATGNYKGNIHVGAGGNCNLGSNAHFKVTVKGEKVHVLITNIDNGKVIYDYSYTIGTNENDQIWADGTFGFRMRGGYAKNNAKSAGQAYFDNLKVTTANEVDLGGTGIIPDSAPVGNKLLIDTSNLTPVYTNNFDKASDIEDWTQYRGTWSVYQGKLYLSACTGGQSFILYGGKADLVGLSDYVVDVDVYNLQTQGGIVARSDYANVTGETDSGIMGYQAFTSSTATQGALGAGKPDGKWLDGNIKVSPVCLQPGMNVHLQFAVKGNVIQFVITDLASGKVLWQWAQEHDMWSKGTFGFRMRGTPTAAGLDNLNKTGLDNLVVSTFGGSATPTDKTEVKLTVGSKTAYVNGKEETLSAPAINRGGRVLLPVRFLANAFGVSNDGIAWDAATRTATLKNDKVTIVVTIDAPSMTVNGETVALDSPAIISDNSTYLPVRAIANALGVANENITWDAATNTATLVK